MHRPESTVRTLQSVGVVHRIDTVNRELAVLVNGELLTFDVPPRCAVILHGERVKFRMLLPRDPVRVTHLGGNSSPVALAIEVWPDAEFG